MNKLYQQITKTVAITLLLLTAFTNTVMAKNVNVQTLGSMEVHYIALDSTFLTPAIAKKNNIERSRYNALINISVLDANLKNHPAKSVLISGTAQNNIGQSTTLDFKEVKEGSAIYYLAQLHYKNKEMFHFTIKINGGNGQKTLKFDHTFYVD